MVLQLFPQDFVVDDHPGHRDPRKMLASLPGNQRPSGHRSMQEHNAIIGAVNQAHLAVEEIGVRGAGRLLRGGAAGESPRRHRGGGYRRAVHRTGGVLRRRDAPGLHRADLRRSLHARPGARPVPELRGRRDGEAGVRRRAWRRTLPENILVELPTPDDREPREARAPAGQPRFWKPAPRSCSASCAGKLRAWAWSAR